MLKRFFCLSLILLIAFQILSCRKVVQNTSLPKQVEQISAKTLAQEFSNFSLHDSIIALWLKELNEDFHAEDSIYGETIGGFSEGQVVISPDSTFKIFNFNGESCGAKCSSMHQSFIQNNKNQWFELENLGCITEISKIDSLYPIISRRQYTGITGGTSWSVHLAYSNHLNEIKAVQIQNEYLEMEDYNFSIFAHFSTPDALGKITYHPFENEFRFSYKPAYIEDDELQKLRIPKLTDLEKEQLVIFGKCQLNELEIKTFQSDYALIPFEIEESHFPKNLFTFHQKIDSKQLVIFYENQNSTYAYQSFGFSETSRDGFMVLECKNNNCTQLIADSLPGFYVSDGKFLTIENQTIICIETAHTYGHSEHYWYIFNNINGWMKIESDEAYGVLPERIEIRNSQGIEHISGLNFKRIMNGYSSKTKEHAFIEDTFKLTQTKTGDWKFVFHKRELFE
jgi:hypothetical protein